MPIKSIATIALLTCLAACSGQPQQKATTIAPENADPFQPNNEAVTEMLETYVSESRIAGANALIWQDGEEAYFNSVGMADIEAGREMRRDTLFQIFSMTKPVTGVALMSLYEKDLFELDDPLADYLPEYNDMQVFTGLDENGEPVFEPAARAILIEDILRHTAGFGYGNEEGEFPASFYVEADILNPDSTLADLSQKLGDLPLYYQPGEQWKYSIAVSVQARLVEVLSGQSFADYLDEVIFTPLGMDTAGYFVEPGMRERMAGFYNDASGRLERVPDEVAYASNYNPDALTPGGFGLVMTIDDYARFARMLLNKGELDGVRILQHETVEMMATDHLPDTVETVNWLSGKGEVGFGYDVAVRLAPPDDAEEPAGAVGEFFWDGYASTLFWVDPENDLTAILMVQKIPFDEIGLHRNFRNAVYEGSDFTYMEE